MRKYIISIVICLNCIIANQAFALDKWVKAESKHFIVYSNSASKDTIAYAKRLEQFRYVLSAFYNRGIEDTIISDKLEIYLVKSLDSFQIVAPGISEHVYGFVRPCVMGTSGFSYYEGDKIRDTKDVRNQSENRSLNVIFHEYTHIFMFQNANIYYPEWFVEGFAEYYGPSQISGDKAIVGYADSGRYYNLIMPGQSIDYKNVLIITPEIRKDPQKYSSFYAQSWLLTHYIMSDPERKKKLAQYFNETNAGADEVEVFERLYGIKLKDLDRVLMRYLDRDLKATMYRLNQMPEPEIKTTDLPKSADKLLIMNAAAINCPSSDYEPKLLKLIESEAAKYPNDDFANMAVANANIYVGPEEKAVDFYKALTAANPNDAKGFFNLGLAYFLMAKHEKFLPKETYESQMKMARGMFGKSYSLNPANAVNLYYFSLTAPNGSLKPDESSYNAATEAFLSSPTMIDYAYNAMHMQLRNGDLDDAKYTMQIIVSNPHIDDSYKTNLKNAIKAINDKKPLNKIYEALNATILPKL